MWLATIVSILPGLLDLASPLAANAIFAATAVALDLSYIIPIFLSVVDLITVAMSWLNDFIDGGTIAIILRWCLGLGRFTCVGRWDGSLISLVYGLFFKALLAKRVAEILYSWTLFVSVILSFPTIKPVTSQTMNYASVITGGVIILAM